MSTSTPSVLTRVQPLALVAVGGFAGAVLRHGLAVELSGTLPRGTLAANVLGAFVLGVLLCESRLRSVRSAESRLLVGTGFCGSLTTYSTFALETTGLDPVVAAANVGGTYALGFGAILLGEAVARWRP
jgi:CrcB protein